MVDLSDDQAAYIEHLVHSGRYESSSAVIQAGLQALQERDEATDNILRQEVVPVLQAMQADPERGIPAKRVFDEIRTLHSQRLDTGDR